MPKPRQQQTYSPNAAAVAGGAIAGMGHQFASASVSLDDVISRSNKAIESGALTTGQHEEITKVRDECSVIITSILDLRRLTDRMVAAGVATLKSTEDLF